MNRSLHAVGVRPHLIGDCVAATIIPPYLKRRFGNDLSMQWVVSTKCSQAAPLWLNHPAIDRIWVSSDPEGYDERIREIAMRAHVVFDPCPPHPDGDGWVNLPGRTIYSEAWRMAGLPLSEYDALPKEEQTPRLYQWFKTERRAKSIAIWPGARQGEKENRRNPPWEWWLKLAQRLIEEGYTVLRCGHPNDGGDDQLMGMHDLRHLSFVDLIAASLGCSVALGTDSGSMIALASYHATPTISCISPHWPNHVSNPLAFGPLGKNHTNLWAPSNLDHDLEKVVDTVKQLT